MGKLLPKFHRRRRTAARQPYQELLCVHVVPRLTAILPRGDCMLQQASTLAPSPYHQGIFAEGYEKLLGAFLLAAVLARSESVGLLNRVSFGDQDGGNLPRQRGVPKVNHHL